jgi:hypothetical protein
MQNVFVDLQDRSIDLQDDFVDLQDRSIGMQDDFVELQDHSIDLQDDFVELQDRSIDLQDHFIELQDDFVYMQDDFTYLQKILLTYLQAASPTAKASSFILVASNATAAIFCVNSLFSTKFCAGSSKKAISFSSFAPACSVFTPSLHLPTEKSSEVGSPSVKH